MTLSVIGAGLGRTGTMSLKLALEQLGFGPCHHMIEVIRHPQTMPAWTAAMDGDVDWEALLAGYRSVADWPAVAFWRELVEAYPEAKVILTVRDPEAWFRSTQETIFAEHPEGPPNPFTAMIDGMMARFDPHIHDHDRMIAAFEAHNAEVRALIPAKRLLVYEVRQGWTPLCAFLGVPVPAGPMPHANTTEDFQNRPPPDGAPGQGRA